jgi:hypothetical protein
MYVSQPLKIGVEVPVYAAFVVSVPAAGKQMETLPDERYGAKHRQQKPSGSMLRINAHD